MQGRRAGHQLRPRRAGRRRRRSRPRSTPARSRGAALDVFPQRADHRAPAVRLRQRRRHAAPRRLDRRGAGPRRRADRRAGRRRADRRRRLDRREHPGRRGRGHGGARAVPAALPSGSAGSAMALAEGSSVDRIEVEFLGRIAERDTRLLDARRAHRRARRPHRGGGQPRQRAGAGRGARHRGRRDASARSARDFTDLVRVTVVAGERARRAWSGTTLGRQHRPHLLEAWGQRFNLQIDDDHLALFRYRDCPG